LLFGQGVGAAGGGALGGLLGSTLGGAGGFAGSIVGTAIGQLGDTFTELAKAVEKPVENLKLLEEQSVLSGRGVELLAKTLADLGRTAEAEGVIRRDLSTRVDPQTFLSVAAANSSYSRSIAEVQLKLGALLAGPAQEFAAWLARITSQVTNLPAGGGAPTASGAESLRRRGLALQVLGTQVTGLGLGITAASGGALAKPGLALAAGGAGISAFGGTLGGSSRFQKEQLQAAKATAPIFEDIARIESRRIGIQQNIAKASLSGNKALETQLRLEDSLAAIERERLEARARVISGPNDGSVNRQVAAFKLELQALDLREKAARETAGAEAAKNEEDRAQAANETAAAYQLISAESALQLSAIREQISNAQALAAAPAGPVRDTLSLRQQATGAISEARRRELQLGAEIGAARLRGDEQGAARLVEQQKAAAEQTKLSFITGATALKDAGDKLRQSAQDTRNQLQNLRVANLNFLSPQEQQRAFERARAAASSEAQRAGVVFTTTGTLAERTRDFQAFADFRRQERGLTEQSAQLEAAIVEANKPLIATNESLVQANAVVSDAIFKLVEKNWDVTVVVNNNRASAQGDVNGALG
jgi:hypothetical protein